MNLLIGAISGNYSISDISPWVETSNFEGVDRVLLLYNKGQNQDLVEYLLKNNIKIIYPDFDFYNNKIKSFLSNTGEVNIYNSYLLIHNIRFLHISLYLEEVNYKKIFLTDVKDVIFNKSPFDYIPESGLIATSECIKYNEHDWNFEHLYTNLGILGNTIINEEVLNVGVFGGSLQDVKSLCRDIYLLSCGKPKVADQTSFNYLIRTLYKDRTNITDISDKFTIHLHVVNEGKVQFNLNKINEYIVIHQYDRVKNFTR